eukprot:s1200_g11.t1
MSSTEGGGAEGTGGGVSHQLATLVPTFDPAVDDVTTWSNKVELLLTAWPENKIVELATRLILNTKGSAFQKLQLNRKEILVNDPKGIRRLVELVGGSWGQVPLENRYELAEKALFRCQQKADETGDSYIARVDVVWTELIAKSLSLEQLQAYVLLRGSRLSAEDKKRVLVESGAEGTSKNLEWSKVVAAIRMLSSNFFQDYTGSKREKTQKTYDHLAFATDEVGDDEHDEEAFWTSDDLLDDDTIAALASEHDDDATMILQFEDAIMDVVQNDAEVSAFFSSYQDARRRLTERVKFRGFWPVRKHGKGSGVVDLGASQTVIGSKQVVELLDGLPSSVRQRIRISCQALVHHTIAPRKVTAMSSLATQFKEFRKTSRSASQAANQEVLKSMTLEELETEKVAFGESKKGVTFKEAFQDASWVEFILARFETSQKPEHMMFVKYVSLRMEKEKNLMGKDVKKVAKGTSDLPPVPHDVWTELQDPDQITMSPGFTNPSEIQEDMGMLREENQQLSHRVVQIEMMMQEVLEHLRRTSVKTET